nr:MAG TPA: hypothetical protein [Caudoviricetes sp.]
MIYNHVFFNLLKNFPINYYKSEGELNAIL